jgi:hypothetical protein
VDGAKGGDQGECGLAKHAPNSVSGLRVTCAGSHTRRPCTLRPARHTPEVGAGCGKAARPVLCGGRIVICVPTAIRISPRNPSAKPVAICEPANSCIHHVHVEASAGIISRQIIPNAAIQLDSGSPARTLVSQHQTARHYRFPSGNSHPSSRTVC